MNYSKKIKYEDIDDIQLNLPIKINRDKNPYYKIEINQIPIFFPYKPYENQILYMEKVIDALNSKKYAALQSPTGTGKTLCLLCSSLSWVIFNQKKNKKFKGKIIYATRTHSQIDNIIKELNKTIYEPITSTICSRDIFCIHNELKSKYKKNQLNEMCRICRKDVININFEEIENLKQKIIKNIEQLKKEIDYDVNLEVEFSNFKDNIKEYQLNNYTYNLDFIENYLQQFINTFSLNKNNNYLNNIKKELIKLNEKIKIINNEKEMVCKYYQVVLNISKVNYNNLDIESMYEIAKENCFCPFYFNMKKARNTANLIILPYQYILNPFIRKSIRIDMEDSILILDEGHNIIDVLEECSSHSITNKNCEDLEIIYQTIIDSPSNLVNLLDVQNNGNIYNSMINIFKYLNKQITETYIPKKTATLKNTIELNIEKIKNFFYRSYDAQILNKIGINNNENDSDDDDFNNNNIFDEKEKLIYNITIVLEDTKKKIFKYLRNRKQEEENIFKNIFKDENEEKLNSFDILIKFLKTFIELFQIKNSEEILNYFFFLKCNETLNNKRTLSIQSISPLKNFKSIKELKLTSFLLTSGTLTPIHFYESQLGTYFPVKLTNKNIIDSSHIKFDLIYRYLNNTFNLKYKEIKNSFEETNNNIMMKNIGLVVMNLIKKVKKGGVLIFFQSYTKMKNFYNSWVKEKIISEIQQYKSVYCDSKEFRKIIENFKENINSVLLTVSKGIHSEGIDFTDDYGRMVICIGIPFPDISNPKVYMKKKILNDKYSNYIYNNYINKNINNNNNNENIIPISGNDWYVIESMRTTNQCLGRVIRHINDYGSLICIDCRFTEYMKYFCEWFKDQCYVRYFNNKNEFENYLLGVEKFLDNMSLEKFQIENNNILGNKRDRDDDFYLFNQCPICLCDSKKNLFRSKCNHVICYNCWEKILQYNDKCPICRRNVNLDDLINDDDFFFN